MEPSSTSEDAHPIAVRDLPMAVIQKWFHDATGKTETISKTMPGNVIITKEDIDQLVYIISIASPMKMALYILLISINYFIHFRCSTQASIGK